MIDRFVKGVPNFLVAGGKILLVQSSLANNDRTLEMFRELGLNAVVAAQVKVPFETIILIEAEKRE